MTELKTDLTYGETIAVDFAGLPAVSQMALAQRGFNHLMGSEVASKIKAAKDKADEAKTPLSESDIEALTEKHREAFVSALAEGKLGTRASGPKLRGLDKIERDVAVEFITAWAAKNGKKLPSGKGAAEKLATIIANYMSDTARAENVQAIAKERFEAAGAAAGDDFDF